MVKIQYYKWNIVGKTIRAYIGRKKQYTHYCPLTDFIQIVEEILKICKKDGLVSKVDILNSMDNTKLSGGRIFKQTSHVYKIKIVFDILLGEGLIQQKGLKKNIDHRGKIPFGFVLNTSEEKIKKWLYNLK